MCGNVPLPAGVAVTVKSEPCHDGLHDIPTPVQHVFRSTVTELTDIPFHVSFLLLAVYSVAMLPWISA